MADIDLDTVGRERARIRETYLRPAGERPASTARGLHHTALVSSDGARLELIADPLGEMYGDQVL